MSKESKASFHNVKVSPFRETIVFKCARRRSEVRYTMKRKKTSERNIISTIIWIQGIDVLMEVFLYDSFEVKEDIFYLWFVC
jgi:hypothetical protein